MRFLLSFLFGGDSLAKQLRFDIDSLVSMKTAIEGQMECLRTADNSVQEQMKQLKIGWNTPAGKKFFEEQNTEWETEIQNYIDTMKTLVSMLDYAIGEYEEIQRKVNSLMIE